MFGLIRWKLEFDSTELECKILDILGCQIIVQQCTIVQHVYVRLRVKLVKNGLGEC